MCCLGSQNITVSKFLLIVITQLCTLFDPSIDFPRQTKTLSSIVFALSIFFSVFFSGSAFATGAVPGETAGFTAAGSVLVAC